MNVLFFNGLAFPFLAHSTFQYKYQINIDGTVAAYRFPYLLAGDSLVLKQDSPYYEFFYNELKPYEHYVPFNRDLSDLLEKVQWAKEHDKEVSHVKVKAFVGVLIIKMLDVLYHINYLCIHTRFAAFVFPLKSWGIRILGSVLRRIYFIDAIATEHMHGNGTESLRKQQRYICVSMALTNNVRLIAPATYSI